jgi:RNA polymerase sigma-70 factor (ECF subfamily)
MQSLKINTETVNGFIAGDLEAFHAIYELTKQFVYNVVYRILHNHEDAQDMTHDIYIKIYEKRQTFSGNSEFTTWLYRIAVNMAINQTKRQKWLINKLPLIGELFNRSSEEPEFIGFDEQEKIQQVLDRLPPDHKACLVLKDVQGFSYEEIAKTLNINIGTVRSRISRGREKLAILYKESDVYVK